MFDVKTKLFLLPSNCLQRSNYEKQNEGMNEVCSETTKISISLELRSNDEHRLHSFCSRDTSSVHAMFALQVRSFCLLHVMCTLLWNRETFNSIDCMNSSRLVYTWHWGERSQEPPPSHSTNHPILVNFSLLFVMQSVYILVFTSFCSSCFPSSCFWEPFVQIRGFIGCFPRKNCSVLVQIQQTRNAVLFFFSNINVFDGNGVEVIMRNETKVSPGLKNSFGGLSCQSHSNFFITCFTPVIYL